MAGPGRSSSTRAFRRGYVACVSCRTRKARCDISDKPPCAKCRREHRECVFEDRPKAPRHRETPKWANMSEARVGTNAGSTPSFSAHGATPASNANASPQDGPIPSPMPSSLGIALLSPTDKNASVYDRFRSTIVTGTNDALDILSDAAHPRHHLTPATATQSEQTGDLYTSGLNKLPAVSPGGQSGYGHTVLALSEPHDDVLDLWDKCRFVRQGLFTAQEAVTYIDLFFRYLAPLSPVMVNQFSGHSAHERLVVEEAMLCCTLLMISSRFFMLPGAGGASRSHLIHQRLWKHCEMLINRIILGQEKCSTSKTRIVGTIESLMLISDWHPRAIHFPPETDGWDGMLISPGYDRVNRKNVNNEESLIRWREDVFEPAKRASRASWMLLGMASSLAYELGVFSSRQKETIGLSDAEESRFCRARKLLYVYLTSTAERLGYPNVCPESLAIAASRPLTKPALDPTLKSWAAYNELQIDLMLLSRTATSMFFPSASHLHQLVLGEQYTDLLRHFASSLSTWEKLFESKKNEIETVLQEVLLIEFYHLRARTGAVSIQAVVARASSSGLDTAGSNTGDGLSAFMTSQDVKFQHDLIDDCRRVLGIATTEPFRDQLSYAPAHVKISIISASVFLLKALSIGSAVVDIQAALAILDQCTQTLKSQASDDMDFAYRYATLVEKHAAHFRTCLTSAKAQSSNQLAVSTSTFQRGESLVDSGCVGTSPLATSETFVQAQDPMNLVNFPLNDNESDWIGLPFDLGVAPFNSVSDQLSLGLEIDSLDFLWSLKGTG